MIDYKVFRETYCFGCGTQRCMGPEDTDYRDGCLHYKLAIAKDFAKHHLPADKYEHTLRVINYTRELEAGSGANEARVVAALHDVVEDSDVTLDEIEREFGRYIRNCVEVLTHDKETMTYPEYIDLIMKESPLIEPKIVKHADMRDHLRQKETLTPRLKEKYFEVIDRFI